MYRQDAVEALARARTELDSGDSHRLRYAAVELRLVIEALVYDRANAYGEDFPQAEHETWQPQKILKMLIDLDPAVEYD